MTQPLLSLNYSNHMSPRKSVLQFAITKHYDFSPMILLIMNILKIIMQYLGATMNRPPILWTHINIAEIIGGIWQLALLLLMMIMHLIHIMM